MPPRPRSIGCFRPSRVRKQGQGCVAARTGLRALPLMTAKGHKAGRDAASFFSVLDLFSGAGGISEGFRQAGYRAVAASDSDPDAAATYAVNFPEANVITGDIREPSVYDKILTAAKSASVVVGGPPCQAFSQVRNHSRLIDDPRNALYREFVGIVRASLPMAFVMENVTGMDQMGVREQVIADL